MSAESSTRASRGLWQALAGWALFIALETVIQIVFKVAGAGLNLDHGLWPLIVSGVTTPIVWLGFGLYFCGFLVWMTILKEVDLGRAFPMTAIAYVATLASAVLLFHEQLSLVRVAGVAAIIGGVVLLASDPNSVRPSETTPLA